MSNSIRLLLIALAAIAAGVLAASYFNKPGGGGVEVASGTLLPSPRAVPEFTLTDSRGQPFTKSELAGGWSVIFVGFTHCPDICPTTLGLLRTVSRQLAAQDKTLRVLLLSVDPERDTPEVLARYVNAFDPGFVGLTGKTAELDRLGAAMGFVYVKVPGATPETYTLDHSSALILINPQGQVAGYFTPPLKVDALVADFSQLIPASAS